MQPIVNTGRAQSRCTLGRSRDPLHGRDYYEHIVCRRVSPFSFPGAYRGTEQDCTWPPAFGSTPASPLLCWRCLRSTSASFIEMLMSCARKKPEHGSRSGLRCRSYLLRCCFSRREQIPPYSSSQATSSHCPCPLTTSSSSS